MMDKEDYYFKLMEWAGENGFRWNTLQKWWIQKPTRVDSKVYSTKQLATLYKQSL